MTDTIKIEREKETEIIAKIGNFGGLNNARKVLYQEQAQIRGKSGRIRVRRERGQNATKYSHTQTTKHIIATGGGAVDNDERTSNISRTQYGMFLSVAGEYQRKARYIFPLENVKLINDKTTMQLKVKDPIFEVDVFIKEDGTTSPWCKIDFEHAPLAEELKSLGIQQGEFDMILPVGALPFMAQLAFIAGPDMLPNQKLLRNNLYEKEWNRKVDVQAVLQEFCGSGD